MPRVTQGRAEAAVIVRESLVRTQMRAEGFGVLEDTRRDEAVIP
jgi:hypothetical protein